jgi:hypothetical protein
MYSIYLVAMEMKEPRLVLFRLHLSEASISSSLQKFYVLEIGPKHLGLVTHDLPMLDWLVVQLGRGTEKTLGTGTKHSRNPQHSIITQTGAQKIQHTF